jgi:hypothetical protein
MFAHRGFFDSFLTPSFSPSDGDRVAWERWRLAGEWVGLL